VNSAIDNDPNSLFCDINLCSKWLGWKDHFPADQLLPPKKMAGVEGFEPPYGGIKTRCLTAWRHPNLEINRRTGLWVRQAGP
jgi:hypothetical protein